MKIFSFANTNTIVFRQVSARRSIKMYIRKYAAGIKNVTTESPPVGLISLPGWGPPDPQKQ